MSPTYSYYCEKCKAETEEFFSIKEKPDFITCSKCKKGKAKAGLSTPHFVIKGASFANGYSGPSNYITLDKLKKGK